MARTGRCLCGALTYEVSGDPIAVAVCHCTHCQRQSGGPFSVNLVLHESQLEVSGELQTFEETGENDDRCTSAAASAERVGPRSCPSWSRPRA